MPEGACEKSQGMKNAALKGTGNSKAGCGKKIARNSSYFSVTLTCGAPGAAEKLEIARISMK